MAGRQASKKLPILLIVGPFLLIIAAFFLYAIVNFILTTNSSDSSLSSGAYLDTEPSVGVTVFNIIVFLMGAIGVLGILPGIIIGSIMLGRRNSNYTNHSSNEAETHNQRKWGDIE